MVYCLKLIAAAMATGLLLTTAGCASTDDTDASGRRHRHAIHRGGGDIHPSDGITLSQHTPLNKWAKLVPDITSELKKQGFKSANITTTTSSDLAKQSQDIQDYVVNHAVSAQSGKDSANKKDGADEKEITLDRRARSRNADIHPAIRRLRQPDAAARRMDRTHRFRRGRFNGCIGIDYDTSESANASSSDNASTRRTRNRCPVWRTH